jgi:pimeloyl-ACP methyl ester carboxylesterase
MSDDKTARRDRIVLQDVALEILRVGSGAPVLLLHGMQPVDPHSRFLELLARKADVIAPTHPGFGGSSRPDGFETVYDLVHCHLGLMDALGHETFTLIGLSFGGWVAAEIAVACGRRLDRLILVDTLGIKISDRETPDILDVFNTHPAEVRRRSWHDPERSAPDFDAMSDEALTAVAANWSALCLYGWDPYMHNPRLKRWLARFDAPTLVLWGESDGIVTPAYGRAFSELIPGAAFSTIAAAGHHPEIEQPEAVAARVMEFLDQKRER